eukprot:1701138-Rhodomonas_salina.1
MQCINYVQEKDLVKAQSNEEFQAAITRNQVCHEHNIKQLIEARHASDLHNLMFEIHNCCLGDALAYIEPTNEGCQNWIEMLQHNNITFDPITRQTQGSKPYNFIIHLQSVAVNEHTRHLYSQESSETGTRRTEMINDVLRSEERLLKTYEHTALRALVPPYGDLELKFNTVVGIIMNLAAGCKAPALGLSKRMNDGAR